MLKNVFVVRGARFNICGTWFITEVLRLVVVFGNKYSPGRIMDSKGKTLIHCRMFNRLPFIHNSQWTDLCFRGGRTIQDHMLELAKYGISSDEADVTTVEVLRTIWNEHNEIISDLIAGIQQLAIRGTIALGLLEKMKIASADAETPAAEAETES